MSRSSFEVQAVALAAGSTARRTRTRAGSRHGWFYAGMAPLIWVWVAFNVLLFLWLVLQSFRNGNEIFTQPFGLPRSINFEITSPRSASDNSASA